MNRRQLLLRAYRASSSARRRTFEDWMTAAEQYQVHPIDHLGDVIGCILARGPEIHLTAWRRPPGSMRRLVRQVLLDTIERWGYARTAVMADNPAGLAFCRRLGFEVEGEEATEYGPINHLICRRPRHA